MCSRFTPSATSPLLANAVSSYNCCPNPSALFAVLLPPQLPHFFWGVPPRPRPAPRRARPHAAPAEQDRSAGSSNQGALRCCSAPAPCNARCGLVACAELDTHGAHAVLCALVLNPHACLTHFQGSGTAERLQFELDTVPCLLRSCTHRSPLNVPAYRELAVWSGCSLSWIPGCRAPGAS